MPSVARFSIAPVRGLALEHPTEIEVTERGVIEDRRFYLTDESNRLVDRIVVGRLVQVAAHTDPEATTLRMTFPDGTVIEGDVELGEAVETLVHGRTTVGHVVIGPWGEALAPIAGRAIRVIRCDRPGGTRAGNPTSIISDGSLHELAHHADVDAVDARRFRMLIDLHGAAPREEDTWIGQRIAIGDAILRVTKPVARCAITTQHPDTGDRDLDTLRTIISYRGMREGKHADLGVLADVERPGRMRLGDEVRVLSNPTADREAAPATAG
jgi:uncharacterized protein YcbX